MDRGVPAGERPQASTASGKCASIPATGTDHGSRMFISRSDLSHRSPMRNDSKSPFAGADCLVGHRPREFLFTAIPPQKQGVHGLPLVRSCRCCSRRTGTGPASAGPRRKRAQAIEDGCGRCVSERLRPAPVAAFAAGPGFAQHAGNRLRREIDARPAGCTVPVRRMSAGQPLDDDRASPSDRPPGDRRRDWGTICRPPESALARSIRQAGSETRDLNCAWGSRAISGCPRLS